jgi:hypothetical protein
MNKLTLKRNCKTIEEKYAIIKYYDSIENIGRGAKQKTVDIFHLTPYIDNDKKSQFLKYFSFFNKRKKKKYKKKD